MKTRHLTILFTLIIFILLGTVLLKMPQFAATSRGNDPIPYIYYYSDLHHAWVIERADGTDSRLLAQGVMPEAYNGISSAQWSPSGEWFAWTGFQRGDGASRSKGWIVSSDGQELSHLLDDADSVFFTEWAQDEDWLFVGLMGTFAEGYQEFRIIDVPNQRILARLRQNRRIEYGGYASNRSSRYGLSWSEDGNAVYLMNNPITRLDVDGHVETWSFYESSPLIDFSNERLVSWRFNQVEQAYEAFIQDLASHEEYLIDSFEDTQEVERPDYNLEWSPSRNYALISESECADEYPHVCESKGFSFLDWVNRAQYPLPTNLEIPYDSETYYNNYLENTVWSPDEGVSILKDDEEQYYLLDTNSHELYPLLSNVLEWDWLPNNDVMLLVTDESYSSNRVYLYDWASKSLSEIETNENVYIWSINVSQDGSFVGWVGGIDAIVENLASGEVYTYSRHSAITANAPITAYQWGQNPEWFFSGGNTVFASGGFDSRAIMIHHLHEATGREITLCYSLNTCAGFLPNHVLPYLGRGQAESFTPAPEQILLHDKTLRGLAWNADGSRLATVASDWDEGGTINIWNMDGEEAYLEESFASEHLCNWHPSVCPVYWLDEERIAFISDYNANVLEEINIRTGERNQSERERASFYYSISSDGRYELVFSGDEQEITHLVDTETGQRISENPLAGMSQYDVYHFDYHPETGLLVGSNVYRRGRLWDVATGEQIATLNWTGYGAVFSPDGQRLAVASSEFVTIWDMSEYIENR